MVFGHFLLGSHNFMVTTLASCVKWPKLTSFPPKLVLRRMHEVDFLYWKRIEDCYLFES